MITIRGPRSSLGLPVLALAACLLAVSAASADQVVYFVNGKAMMVKSVERGERFTILEMEGGGKMGVPTEQILKIEEYQVQAPVVQAPMAAPVAQIPIVPATPAELAGSRSFAPAVPGPGVGGAPQAPGQGVQRLTPQNIGGAAQGYQSQRPQQAFANRPALGGPAGALQPAPGYQRPALYGPGGRKLGRQGMGRRGGPVPNAPPGSQPGQTTNSPAAGSGGQETTTPQEPPDDPGEPDGQGGEPEQQEPPAGGGGPQEPGGSSGD